jgi:hypothetical protein
MIMFLLLIAATGWLIAVFSVLWHDESPPL